MKYILALDQGTTSSRCIVFDQEQNIVCARQKEFAQLYPQPGWVEHDPAEIFSTQYDVMKEAVDSAGVPLAQIAGIGITNQRETTIVWEKETGMPIYNAIVWQCRRTAEICEQLKKIPGFAELVHERTGLVIDAYFSGTKIKWILDHVEGARERAQRGELLFGTVDSWLLWNLTGGQTHKTDLTNASRTMLFNIHTQDWDDEILTALQIPRAMLPQVEASFARYGDAELYGTKIPIAGVAGDQQAALFGQLCFSEGQAKNTYGTGCFLLMNTGGKARRSQHGLLTTIAASTGAVQYAMEGSVFMGGAVVQWLRDEMRLIKDSRDSEYYATKVVDNGGVYFVPAFTGLGAPYWDMYARGTITGLTRGAGFEHIIRAGLEAIAYQSRDVLMAMQRDTGVELNQMKVDGGASANDFLMQFQADITNTRVVRPRVRETTALGAAYLAGLCTGVWGSQSEIERGFSEDKTFTPAMPNQTREHLVHGWEKAVRQARAE